MQLTAHQYVFLNYFSRLLTVASDFLLLSSNLPDTPGIGKL
jgi:hypothetical protein